MTLFNKKLLVQGTSSLFCMLSAFLFPTASAAPSIQSPSRKPALNVVSPTYGSMQTGASLKVSITLDEGENASTLKVSLNGNDINGRLSPGACTNGACTREGTVSFLEGLKPGQNLLFAQVNGLHEGVAASQRITFNYQETASTGASGNTIQNYEPVSVGIRTINPGGGSPWFEIDTGNTMGVNDPVASFPALPGATKGSTVTTFSIAYPDTQFSVSCSTVLQAIVLKRSAPSVQETTACGDTVSAIETSLGSALGRSLNNSDLVVLGTTPGNTVPSSFDTSSLGGTNYSNLVQPQLAPLGYMMIGVPGATAGSARESYFIGATSDTLQYQPFLKGTLMQDTSGNYNYIPSDERSLQVVSNATSPSITVGGQQYTPPSSGGEGTFWLLVLDRELLQPINYSSLSGWTNCPYDSGNASCGGIFNPRSDSGKSLAQALAAVNPRNFVFLVAQGCPFDNLVQVGPDVKNAVNALGGAGYSLQKLNSQTNTCAYSLVSSNLPFPVNIVGRSPLRGSVALSANQFSAQLQTGIVHGFLARNNQGIYDIGNNDQGTTVQESPTGTVDYTFEQTASSQRQDWPLTDTPGHLAAYHDISQQLLTDSSLAETGSYDYDVRYFYTNPRVASGLAALIDSRLGTTATNPVIQQSYDTATAGEFNDIRAEILTELQNVGAAVGYLTGSGGNGGVAGVLNGATATIFADAFAVANAIGNDQNNAAAQIVNANSSNILNFSAGITSLIAPIAGAFDPAVGILFGVMSGALWTGSAAETPFSGSIPGPESSYDIQLSAIISDADSYTQNAMNGFAGAVDNILSDSAKLSTIGGLVRDANSNWDLSSINSYRTLSNAFSDGERRSLWLNVLQGLYGIRAKYAYPTIDPARFGSDTYLGIHGTKVCGSVYSAAQSGVVPASSQVAYPTPGNPSLGDTFILANGANPTQPNYSITVSDVAASTNLSTLLTTDQSVAMKGGTQTGLNIPATILLSNSNLNLGPPLYFNPSTLCQASNSSKAQDAFTTVNGSDKAP